MAVAQGDRAEFRALVDELADLETRRTGSGGYAAEDAVRLQQIERRLLQLVTTELPQDERRKHVRLPCDLAVQLHTAGGAGAGHVIDVGTGGIFVESAVAVASGDSVDVEIKRSPGSLEHSLKVKGKVAWATTNKRTGKPGFGVAFVAGDEPSERRLRRFVIELLKKRMP